MIIDSEAETDRIVRRDTDDDIQDHEADVREARAAGWNAALELAASLARLDGDKRFAQLLLRQRKGGAL